MASRVPARDVSATAAPPGRVHLLDRRALFGSGVNRERPLFTPDLPASKPGGPTHTKGSAAGRARAALVTCYLASEGSISPVAAE
jgi:hypothetical protein